jgi:hypothetical protein
MFASKNTPLRPLAPLGLICLRQHLTLARWQTLSLDAVISLASVERVRRLRLVLEN